MKNSELVKVQEFWFASIKVWTPEQALKLYLGNLSFSFQNQAINLQLSNYWFSVTFPSSKDGGVTSN